MELNQWKHILFDWIKASELIDLYGALEHVKIDSYFDKFYHRIYTNANDSSLKITEFLKDQYPDFELLHDETNNISSQDYVYVFSLLLHYSCVVEKSQHFQAACTKLNSKFQFSIASFFECMSARQSSFTKEFLRTVIKKTTSTMSPQPQTVYFSQTSPLKSTPKKSDTSPTSKEIINSRIKELSLIKSQLENEKYERSLVEIDLKNSQEKITKLVNKCNSLKHEIQALKSKKEQESNSDENSSPNKAQRDWTKRKMQKEIQQRDDLIVDLKFEIENANATNRKFQEKITEMDRKMNEMRFKIHELDDSIENLVCTLDHRDKEIKALLDERKELLEFINENKSSCGKDISSECMDFSYSTLYTTSCNDSGQESLAKSVIDVVLKEKEIELEKLTELLEKAENRKVEVETRNLELEKRIEEVLKNKIAKDGIEEIFKEKLVEIQSLCQENEEKSMKIQSLCQENEEKSIKIQSQCEENEEKSTKIQSLCAENEEKSMKIQSLCVENEEKTMRIQQLVMKIEEIDELKNQKLMLKMLEENDLLKSELELEQTHKSDLEVLKTENLQQKSKLEYFEKELNAQKSLNFQLISNFEAKTKQFSERIEIFSKETDLKLRQKDENIQKLTEVLKSLKINQLVAQFEAEKLKLNQKLEELEEKHKKEEIFNEKLSQNCDIFKAKLRTARDEKDSIEMKLKELVQKSTEDRQKLQSKMETKIDEQKAKHRTEMLKILDENKNIQERLRIVEVENAKVKALLNEKEELLIKCENSLSKVQHENAQFQHCINEKEKAIQNMMLDLLDEKKQKEYLNSKLKFFEKNDNSVEYFSRLSNEIDDEKFSEVFRQQLKNGTDFENSVYSAKDIQARNSRLPPQMRSSYASYPMDKDLTEDTIKNGKPNINENLPHKSPARRKTGVNYQKPGPPTPSKHSRAQVNPESASNVLKEKTTNAQNTPARRNSILFWRRKDENSPKSKMKKI